MGFTFFVGKEREPYVQSARLEIYGKSVGIVSELAIKDKFGCKVRSVELNLPQRCAGHILSMTDIDESSKIGCEAVRAATNGVSGEVMVFVRHETSEYDCDIEHRSVMGIANATRYVPDEFISEDNNDVTDACCEYLRPLIEGEYPIKFEKGLPKHIVL